MVFPQSSSSPEKRVELHRPAPGQSVVISPAERSVLVFGFSLEDQVMTVQGEDLQIAFPDGASITLVNFFVGGIQESPHIELADGSGYSGLEFFTRFEPLLLEAVQPQGTHESGLPAYNDDPGSLIAGVDRLGALGTDYWGRGTEPDITQIGLMEQGGTDEDAGPPVITVAGSLVIAMQMHEDGQPDQYRLVSGADPATGSRDGSLETPYDTATGMPISIDLTGAPSGVTVYSLTMGGLPDASQGTIYYKGQPVAAGQVILAPELDGFSFKPEDNFSGSSVAIDLGVVTAGGVSLAIADTDEDAASQMRFSLDGGDGNDAVSSITLTDLKGGSIVDANGNVLFNGAPAALDPATALAGGYYYLPAPNAGGDFSIAYNAVVADSASGATKTFDDQSAQVSVTPVTDTPSGETGSGGQAVFEPGHVASVPVQIQAAFEDTDGSENHFFLVSLPAGAIPPSGWAPETDPALLEAAGLTGQTVYRMEANASGRASFNISLPENNPGGQVSFVAGSVEQDGLASGNPDYRFGGTETIPVEPTGTINLTPEGQSLSLNVGGSEGLTFSDTLSLADPDGDAVSIAGLASGGASAVPGNNGGYTLAGEHGQLVLNADGTYTYTMDDAASSGTDVFSVTLADAYGGTAVTSLTFDVSPSTTPLVAPVSLSLAGTGDEDAVMGAEFITKSVASSLDADDAIPLPDTPETEDPYGDEADYDSPSALLAMAAFGIDVEAHLTAKANEGLEDLSAYHDLSPTGVAAATLYATGLYDQDDAGTASPPDVEFVYSSPLEHEDIAIEEMVADEKLKLDFGG